MLVATLRGTAALALVAALAACGAPQGGNIVTADQAQSAQSVQFGNVVSARDVLVQGGGGTQVLGAVLGGVAGAALGNQVGGGTGKDVATAVGATAGVAAGQAAGRNAGSKNSIEWTVRLENGSTIAVVQSEPTFSIGQRVQVISGSGSTRLVPA